MKRWQVPEVVQSSAMDCGPASLKALLEGFGIHASYGRLREACQTSVDGTSIDALEETAIALGLDASQIMAPADHLVLPESAMLPALVVVRLPNGATHFVVVWRRIGGLPQINARLRCLAVCGYPIGCRRSNVAVLRLGNFH